MTSKQVRADVVGMLKIIVVASLGGHVQWSIKARELLPGLVFLCNIAEHDCGAVLRITWSY